MFRKAAVINVLVSLIGAALVDIGIWVFCEPSLETFLAWQWQAFAVLIWALVIQNFMHMRWLQREAVVERWSSGDSSDYLYDTVMELLYFPFKAVVLASSLWIAFGAVAAWLFVVESQSGIGNGFVVFSLILAAGSVVSFVQLFVFRILLFPKLEQFLSAQSEEVQRRLGEGQMPFTVRAKLILQSCFSLLVVILLVLSIGYGVQRNGLISSRQAQVQETLRLVGPALGTVLDGRDDDVRMEILETFGRILGGGLLVTDNEMARSLMWAPPGMTELKGVLTKSSNMQDPNARDWLLTRVEYGSLSLIGGVPWNDFGGVLSFYIYLFMIASGIGAVLIFTVSFLASHDLSRSVRRVEKWAEQLGQGVLNHGQRVPEDDEIADLIFRLDFLRDRLASLLNQMEKGTSGTQSLSGNVREHAVYLRQTIEEDSNLIGLTSSLLARLSQSLSGQQATVSSLTRASEETSSSATEMSMVLRELDNAATVTRETVTNYQDSLKDLESLVNSCRDDLTAFSTGAEEAKRSIMNLDDVLEHLMETVRRSRQLVVRASDQNLLTLESVERSRSEVQNLEDTLRDSSMLIDHLTGTMDELNNVASAIHEVAEDTKLLSLNASIRSVKAKDEGRSFSVISQTIQDLAEETQASVERLMEEIAGLMKYATRLEGHVLGLVESMNSASTEANESSAIWRDSRTRFQSFMLLEERFEHFVQDLRSYRDSIRTRHVSFEGQAQLVARLLGDLLNGLAARLQQIEELEERTNQIRNYSSYQVSKGRFVSDHVDQVRSMATHVNSFVVDQLRNVDEVAQNLDHLERGMAENVAEARLISGGLQNLERAIRRFHDAFSQFRFRDY